MAALSGALANAGSGRPDFIGEDRQAENTARLASGACGVHPIFSGQQPREACRMRAAKEHSKMQPAGRKDTAVTISAGPRLRAAFALAVVADLVQMFVSPLFFEGAASPADDVLDVSMAGILAWLLGWHWEFMPSFAAKLVPGVDLVPLWTLAVANVYRKSRPAATAAAAEQRHA